MMSVPTMPLQLSLRTMALVLVVSLLSTAAIASMLYLIGFDADQVQQTVTPAMVDLLKLGGASMILTESISHVLASWATYRIVHIQVETAAINAAIDADESDDETQYN
jgi:hypothetical protein